MIVWPMEYRGEERTRTMLQRAWDEDGDEREAMRETHGKVSDERAPHQELRKQFGASA